MAATDPRQEPAQRDDRHGRPTLAPSSMSLPRRPRWMAIAIGVVVLAVIGVIAYLLLYNGDGGYGGGSGGGGGGGGYFMLALSAEQTRRLRDRMTAKR
jgi:peptidoglycan/LPS O-acetylase OafA/YrhL